LRRYRKPPTMLEQRTPASGLVELLRFGVEALETLPPEPGVLASPS
jgi:hypothetical protein